MIYFIMHGSCIAPKTHPSSIIHIGLANTMTLRCTSTGKRSKKKTETLHISEALPILFTTFIVSIKYKLLIQFSSNWRIKTKYLCHF